MDAGPLMDPHASDLPRAGWALKRMSNRKNPSKLSISYWKIFNKNEGEIYDMHQHENRSIITEKDFNHFFDRRSFFAGKTCTSDSNSPRKSYNMMKM